MAQVPQGAAWDFPLQGGLGRALLVWAQGPAVGEGALSLVSQVFLFASAFFNLYLFISGFFPTKMHK